MSGAYSTVKASLMMLANHFAIEWAGDAIRVNAVCPGHTDQRCDMVLLHQQRDELPSVSNQLARVSVC